MISLSLYCLLVLVFVRVQLRCKLAFTNSGFICIFVEHNRRSLGRPTEQCAQPSAAGQPSPAATSAAAAAASAVQQWPAACPAAAAGATAAAAIVGARLRIAATEAVTAVGEFGPLELSTPNI